MPAIHAGMTELLMVKMPSNIGECPGNKVRLTNATYGIG
jgi:hypothetical protein